MAYHVKRSDGTVAGFIDDHLERAEQYAESIGGELLKVLEDGTTEPVNPPADTPAIESAPADASGKK